MHSGTKNLTLACIEVVNGTTTGKSVIRGKQMGSEVTILGFILSDHEERM